LTAEPLDWLLDLSREICSLQRIRPLKPRSIDLASIESYSENTYISL